MRFTETFRVPYYSLAETWGFWRWRKRRHGRSSRLAEFCVQTISGRLALETDAVILIFHLSDLSAICDAVPELDCWVIDSVSMSSWSHLLCSFVSDLRYRYIRFCCLPWFSWLNSCWFSVFLFFFFFVYSSSEFWRGRSGLHALPPFDLGDFHLLIAFTSVRFDATLASSNSLRKLNFCLVFQDRDFLLVLYVN